MNNEGEAVKNAVIMREKGGRVDSDSLKRVNGICWLKHGSGTQADQKKKKKKGEGSNNNNSSREVKPLRKYVTQNSGASWPLLCKVVVDIIFLGVLIVLTS